MKTAFYFLEKISSKSVEALNFLLLFVSRQKAN